MKKDGSPLRKHTYSNIKKISRPKKKKKNSDKKYYNIFFIFLLKAQIVGTRKNRLADAVLTSTHKLCF